ncbi:MAG TPA: capsular biosynthesis protein, partial [Cyanobacteria bacterium UBA11049]|nr:capsular biosynthesis protein [Cyanobacteria bacterium UBA11049]
MKPQNLEEKVVWYYIIGTLLLYFLGAQYVAAPLMAYFLVYRLVRKWWTQTDETPIEERVRIPVGVWVWMGCISFVAIALVMSHLDFGYGNAQIAKSLVNGFLRTWALFAVFPLIGCLNIRPQIIYRAICILCLQCLILVPITYVLHFAGIDPVYGMGLLKKIGGNSYNYYQVRLYIGAADGMRLYLFAPWAPALGLVANVFFWLSTQEADKRWRFLA